MWWPPTISCQVTASYRELCACPWQVARTARGLTWCSPDGAAFLFENADATYVSGTGWGATMGLGYDARVSHLLSIRPRVAVPFGAPFQSLEIPMKTGLLVSVCFRLRRDRSITISVF